MKKTNILTQIMVTAGFLFLASIQAKADTSVDYEIRHGYDHCAHLSHAHGRFEAVCPGLRCVGDPGSRDSYCEYEKAHADGLCSCVRERTDQPRYGDFCLRYDYYKVSAVAPVPSSGAHICTDLRAQQAPPDNTDYLVYWLRQGYGYALSRSLTRITSFGSSLELWGK